MLESIADDLWCVNNRLGAVEVPIRMTVLRLVEGLILHSPTAIDDKLAQAIERLGRVTVIVAPSGYHHLFASDAKSRYPDATLWVTPQLTQKRKEFSGTQWRVAP